MTVTKLSGQCRTNSAAEHPPTEPTAKDATEKLSNRLFIFRDGAPPSISTSSCQASVDRYGRTNLTMPYHYSPIVGGTASTLIPLFGEDTPEVRRCEQFIAVIKATNRCERAKKWIRTRYTESCWRQENAALNAAFAKLISHYKLPVVATPRPSGRLVSGAAMGFQPIVWVGLAGSFPDS